MDVVRQQTRLVVAKAEAVGMVCDQGKEGLAIFIIAENGLTIMMEVDQVITGLGGPL
jgi:hypothetical protein